MPKRSAEGGFLYIEVLLSLAILSMAMLALVPMFVMASAENAAAQDYTFAVAFAQHKVEELKVTALASLADGKDSVDSHGITFVRTWIVTDNAPQVGMKTVAVTVTAGRTVTFGQPRSATVSFYRGL